MGHGQAHPPTTYPLSATPGTVSTAAPLERAFMRNMQNRIGHTCLTRYPPGIKAYRSVKVIPSSSKAFCRKALILAG
jgi:hypothetical protein